MTPPVGAARAGVVGAQRDELPDSGLVHQYDWSNTSTTTSSVPDLEGSSDLNEGVGFTDLSSTIGGRQAGTFDGADDLIQGSFATIDPCEVWAVGGFDTPKNGENNIFVDGYSTYTHSVWVNNTNSDNFAVFAGSEQPTGIVSDTDDHIFNIRFDSSGNEEFRLDGGSDSLNTDAGSNIVDGATVGGRYDLAAYTQGRMGELLFYDPTVSGYSRSDIASYLSNKWGIAI